MSSMTSKNPMQASSSREGIPPGEPLSLASVCLDKETWGVLKLFADSTSIVRLQKHLNDYRVHDHESVSDWIGDPAPDICLLDFDADRRGAAAVAERIHAEAPETAIFAVSSQSQPDLIIQAMRSGCSEYLLKPLDPEQLLDAVARVGGRRREKKDSERADVHAFIGAKGGCGVTTLVTQLGALLARACGKKTLLLDLHRDFGDAALYLGLTKYRYNFFELAENTDRLDAELLQSFVLHHSSGLDLIPAPHGTEPAHDVISGALTHTLDFVRSRYDFVLLDLPVGLNDNNLELIRHCDQINVVTVAEVSALRNVVRQTEYFTRKHVGAERIKLVLNRYHKRALITEAQIEKSTGHKIFWKVPNQYVQVVKAISGGDLANQISNSEVAKNLQDWAAALGKKSGAEGKKKEGRGLLSLWNR
jgi:pilus assembly protein CpaE